MSFFISFNPYINLTFWHSFNLILESIWIFHVCILFNPKTAFNLNRKNSIQSPKIQSILRLPFYPQGLGVPIRYNWESLGERTRFSAQMRAATVTSLFEQMGWRMDGRITEAAELLCKVSDMLLESQGTVSSSPASSSHVRGLWFGPPTGTVYFNQQLSTSTISVFSQYLSTSNSPFSSKHCAMGYWPHRNDLPSHVHSLPEEKVKGPDDFFSTVVNEFPSNISEHTEMLRYLQKRIVRRRPLEVSDPTASLEGETSFITVDRHTLQRSLLRN